MNVRGKQIISVFVTAIFMMVVFLQPVHQLAHSHGTSHHSQQNDSNIPQIQHKNICFLCDFTLPAATEFAVTDFDFKIQEFSNFRSEEHTSELQSREKLVCR